MMPTSGGYYYGFWEVNPTLWQRCRTQVAQQMCNEGWNRHARKFNTVQHKRAFKLFLNSRSK